MRRVMKLIILKGSLVTFTFLLLSVSGSPVNVQAVVDNNINDLTKVRDHNEKTLKKIDHEFQRAAQFFKH